MNISDFGATSRSDVATVLLGAPAAYFGWVLFGDTSLVDPQYAAPLIGAAVLGLKKTVELSLPWRRVRQGRALARVRGTLAALPGSVGGKPPLAELLDDMERVSLGERRRVPVENLVDTTRATGASRSVSTLARDAGCSQGSGPGADGLESLEFI